MDRAVRVIRQTVSEQAGWRWRGEVGELFRVLEEGLAARTLAQVTAIQPPPQEITSSLPVLLVQKLRGHRPGAGRVEKGRAAWTT